MATNASPTRSLRNSYNADFSLSPITVQTRSIFSTRTPLSRALAGAALALGLCSFTASASAEVTDPVAVYSTKSVDYNRTTLPTGGFKAETFAFGEGGFVGGVMNDYSMDQLKFMDIVRLISPSLNAQNYVSSRSKDPRDTDLLIMVYWGSTGTVGTASSSEYQIAQSMIPPPAPPPPPPPSGPPSAGSSTTKVDDGSSSSLDQAMMMMSMANRQRDQKNFQNAKILGYVGELNRVEHFNQTPFHFIRDDVVGEVEEDRYFVVLLAFDFQTMVKTKQKKLLWEVRYSLPARGNEFNKQLANMSKQASRYFGQDSGGLLRKPLPKENIDIGTPNVIESMETK